ncbi:helix-turn-helix domain-containing protein [Companilactobacillus huachuanensis]|uniref:Helix-turn-helix domain-containing protein n=1 Tax=Companilactobacillus huachuanensis TaxID=2559914 RepID=A0ABW1RMJ7_9LACO|nr:helix-turn-helix domain-containing protein [Companilactobacillus huachuanensis]
MLKISNENLVAFHPGYYVRRYLEDQNMNQRELADRLNTNEKTVSQLINGKIELDSELIEGLALVLGTSESLWKNLNDKYLETKGQIEKQNRLDAEKNVQRQLDYKFWENLGVVKHTNKTVEKISEMKKFFRVSNLMVLENRDFLVQYKTVIPEVKDKNVINSNAWIQTALNMGDLEDVESINLEYLKSRLPDIRKMTIEDPETFMPKLRIILKQAGVAFVVIPNLKNCGVNGAVKWMGKDKVLLVMNDRSKYADIFWFALFHEIRHIFQKKKGHIIVSAEKNIGLKSALDLDRLEKDADDFAKNYLIDQTKYDEFVKEKDFSGESVEKFAEKNQINSGIVIGRLQQEKYLGYSQLNDLRQKLTVSADK